MYDDNDGSMALLGAGLAVAWIALAPELIIIPIVGGLYAAWNSDTGSKGIHHQMTDIDRQ